MTRPAPKVYLAGPDIFRVDAQAYAKKQKAICEAHGLVPLHPMDNNFSPDFASLNGARDIYKADVAQMLACDVICANMNAFNGAEPDSGTCFEVGFISGLNAAARLFGAVCNVRAVYGYIDEPLTYAEHTARHKNVLTQTQPKGVQFHLAPWTGISVNLMMEIPMHDDGAFVQHGFEACIKRLAADWKAGKLDRRAA